LILIARHYSEHGSVAFVPLEEESVVEQNINGNIRRLLSGQDVPGLVVTRQAFRGDADEAVQIARGTDFWVASRTGECVTVWACADAEAADDKFDQVAIVSDGWTEARNDQRVA
jgi:hypothetical protein